MAVAKGEMEQQNKQSLSELMFSEPMKKATKLLVSVSLFSVIVSYMSWRNSHPLLAFPIQVLSLAHDKNYMFLVCNGILVLLAKTSGRLALRSGPAVFDDLIDGDDVVHPPPPHAKLLDSLLHKEAAMESRLLLLQNAYSDVLEEEEKHVIIEEEEEKHVIEEEREDEDSRSLMIVGDKKEEESDGFLKASLMEEDCRSFIMEGDDHDDHEELEELNNNEVFIEESEKEVAEERERLNKLSPEELNKKFEEFIKKMKEDIRIEAQQQHLVLVK